MNPLDSIVVSATGAHSYDETWTFFSADQHVRYCTVCGKAPEYEAHNVIIKGAGDATCGDEGYTGDEVCTVCGQTIKQGEVIPATGDTTPDEPDDGDACPYCGKVHAKKWVRIVHLVLWFLCKTFHIVKK